MKAKTLALITATALLACALPTIAAPAAPHITDASRIRQDGMERATVLSHRAAGHTRPGEVAVMLHDDAEIIVSVSANEAKKMRPGQIVDVIAAKNGELFARMTR